MPDFLEAVDSLAGRLADASSGYNYGVVIAANLLVARQLLLSAMEQCDMPVEVHDLVELIEQFTQAMRECSAQPSMRHH